MYFVINLRGESIFNEAFAKSMFLQRRLTFASSLLIVGENDDWSLE